MSVWLIATLDTKGQELAFVRAELARCGVKARIIDAGCLGEPAMTADVTRDDVFSAAGSSLADVRAANDRGQAVTLAAKGVAAVVVKLAQQGQIDGVLGIGGSAGTTIATAAMRVLPIGLPKVMVSTLASGQTRPYVGVKDLFMLNSVVDIAGVNRVSRLVLSQAARAMAGMCNYPPPETPAAEKPLIAATMFGVTTPCVQHARQRLEAAGYEVLVFHATGTGGEAMEALIDDGLIAGVLDITTTELADELVGGVLTAGPNRLTAAARRGVPQVVSVGATDMVNFGPPETIPEAFRHRQFYQHNPTVTLMRTTPDECAKIGADIASKLSEATGPIEVLLPLKGVSAIDAEGKPFHDAVARQRLYAAIRGAKEKIPIVELDAHINDPQFAEAAADALLQMLRPA
jgi:uncharacterized protein (UPF0261 family)